MSALLFELALQSPAQLLAEFAQRESSGALLGNYVVVRRRKKIFVLPVKFANHPLDAISGYGVTDLATYGYTDTNGRSGMLFAENNKIGGVKLLPLAGQP